MTSPEEKYAMASAINNLAAVHDEQLGNIADALKSISTQLKNLGVGDAITSMGAIEMLSVEIKNASTILAQAINNDE